MPQIDFDPDEPLEFPHPIVKEQSSRELMAAIRATPVPANQAAVWFLGQNSWILKGPESPGQAKPEGKRPAGAGGPLVAIDPYLTDWCASKDTGLRAAKSRLLPVFIEPEDLDVDFVLISHSHPDHCDPFTLRRLSIKQRARFLAPWQCLPLLAGAGIPDDRVTLMHPLQTVALGGGEAGAGGAAANDDQLADAVLQVTGVFALPTDATDLNHIGYIMRFANGKTYYNSGDTAYHELLAHVKAWRPEVMSICINGGYHNLSHWEAARITAAIKPRIALPAHFDMMPHNLQPPHMFRKSLWEHDKEIIYHRMDYGRPFFF